MSRASDYFREFEYQEDYEKLIWQREQEKKEQWELSENKKLKDNGKRINEDRIQPGTGETN